MLGTGLNVFAFRLPNVFFSVGTGLVLLTLGGYGRIGSKLPVDNPYYQRRHRDDPADRDHAQPSPAQPSPHTGAEATADRQLVAAERDVAAHADTIGARRVAAMRHVRSHEDRRRMWMSDPNRASSTEHDPS